MIALITWHISKNVARIIMPSVSYSKVSRAFLCVNISLEALANLVAWNKYLLFCTFETMNYKWTSYDMGVYICSYLILLSYLPQVHDILDFCEELLRIFMIMPGDHFLEKQNMTA